MKPFTKKEREIKYKYAKILRDLMLEALGQWEKGMDKELSSQDISKTSIEKIKNYIKNEANRALVWKSLAKEDRYDTPYYKAYLSELRKRHPNLTVKNNYNCFATWPIFNENDIEILFSPNNLFEEEYIDMDSFKSLYIKNLPLQDQVDKG